MIRVLVVDDHVAVRYGLRDIFKDAVGITVAGEAASAAELRQRFVGEPPDIVLLDYNMPGIRGFALLEEARQAWPRTPVLLLSVNAEEDLALAAIAAGAAGYIGKRAEPAALVAAVRRVAAGGRYVSPVLAEKLALSVARGASAGALETTLSTRERYILRRIARGEKPKQIGFALGLSRNTVASYRARLLKKLGLRNNAELVRFALDRGLLG